MHVEVFPQWSVAVYVLVLDLVQVPVVTVPPSEQDTEVVPQISEAVAVPQLGTDVGLHPKSDPGGHEVKVGGVTSTIHVNT